MAKALVNPRSLYTWDKAVLKYRRPDGRFVSQQAIKQALNGYVRRTQAEIQRLSREVAAGKMPVAEWQRLTSTAIKNAHLSAYSAARGGWAQLTQRDYGRIGAELKRQYKHLRGFARKIPVLTPTQVEARAKMYGGAARASYELGRLDGFTDMAAEQGVTVQCRNRLGQGEHCPECLAETAKGWVEIGELSLPGSRICLSNCLCSLTYRVAP